MNPFRNMGFSPVEYWDRRLRKRKTIMMEKNDKLKQEKMRKYYDNSNYYESAEDHFADTKSKFSQYTLRNVFSVYFPQENEKILDVGCGWGNISLALQEKGFDVTGLDYSQKSIEICKQAAQRMGLDFSKFICEDATNTTRESETVDAVYCADLVEHLYPQVYEDLLKEVYRILKKDGKFIIYTPNPHHFFELLKRHDILLKSDISHVDYKTMERLKSSLKDCGFRIEKAFYIESHFPILRYIEKSLLGFIPLFRRRNAVLAIKQ